MIQGFHVLAVDRLPTCGAFCSPSLELAYLAHGYALHLNGAAARPVVKGTAAQLAREAVRVVAPAGKGQHLVALHKLLAAARARERASVLIVDGTRNVSH